MKNKQPPFEITHQIIDNVAQIAELVGRLTAVSSLPANTHSAPVQSDSDHSRLSGHRAEHAFS